MSDFAAWWLLLLADWSVRWAALIALLWIALAVRPPRRVADRLWLCRLVLAAGLVLPVAPRWWRLPSRPTPAVVVKPVFVAPPSTFTAGPELTFDSGPPSVRFDPTPVLPPAPPLVEPWRPDWPLIASGAWLLGVAVMLARLAAGAWWLARVRRRATPAIGDLLAELHAVRDELGVRRPVTLCLSDDVKGPALFGGWRPAVVVPRDWPAFSAADRRAALLHELTHVARRDDWATLAEAGVRAAFWFHPPVRWLLTRLAREREARCDAAAVRCGVRPDDLARLLLAASHRLGPGRSALGLALPMAHRSSVGERIHQLLEADMTRWTHPLSRLRAAVFAVGTFAAAIALGGYGAKADPPTPPPAVPPVAAGAPGVTPALRGTVTDVEGKPVAGATVLAVADRGAGEHVATATDDRGRYEFATLPASRSPFAWPILIAARDGAAPSVRGISPMTPRIDHDLSTPYPGTYRGVVTDEVGKPVAGAEVQVAYGSSSSPAGWFSYVPREVVRGTPVERAFFTATAADGSFAFSALPEGRSLKFRVAAAGFAELDTGAGNPPEWRYVVMRDRKPDSFVLRRGGMLRGRVVSQVAGVGVGNVRVRFDGTGDIEGYRRVVTSAADGTFETKGVPAGVMTIDADLPLDVPATAIAYQGTVRAGGIHNFEVRLIAGVQVTGQVCRAGTASPVAGALVEARAGSLYRYPETGAVADAAGRFTLRVPPGRLRLSAVPPEFRGDSVSAEFAVPAGVATFALPDALALPQPTVRGVVTDAAGKPVEGATVTATTDVGAGTRLMTLTDAAGRFAFGQLPPPRTAFPMVQLVAGLDGHAPATALVMPEDGGATTLTLPAALPVRGRVSDPAGKPVAGATVRVGFMHRHGSGASWGYVRDHAILGSAVEKYFVTAADADGAFTITHAPAGGELILRASAPGFGEVDTGTRAAEPRKPIKVVADAPPVNLTMHPEAVVRGRGVSRVPGVAADAGQVQLEGSDPLHGFERRLWPAADGTFVATGLPAGPLSVALLLPHGTPATAAGVRVTTAAGATSEVALELVPGVEVTGRVRVTDTGEPVAGVHVVTLGAVNPGGFHWGAAPTGADGRFRLRLPPGKVRLGLWRVPAGFREVWARGEIDVPANVSAFELPSPFEVTRLVAGLTGRLTDAAGRPVANATVAPADDRGEVQPGAVATDADGRFALKYAERGALEVDRAVPLRVTLADGRRYEATAVVPVSGTAAVRLATRLDVAGPRGVKAGAVDALVVDEAGVPFPGVAVRLTDHDDGGHADATSGFDGVVHLPPRAAGHRVGLRFTKAGYSPVILDDQATGVAGLVVAMDRATLFEGVVTGPDGKPAAGAAVHYQEGYTAVDGRTVVQWAEAVANAAGMYRLHVAPGEHRLTVKASGVGVKKLPRVGIAHGERRRLDVALEPAVTFRATVMDSLTGKPVAGFQLIGLEERGAAGTSDARGEIVVPDLLPGQARLNVQSDTHARWWSERAVNAFERLGGATPTDRVPNAESLTFDLRPGMAAVPIVAEPGVTITGRVVDPAGVPVAGATVVPKLTADEHGRTALRYTATTAADGTFRLVAPASSAVAYNLVAHDGKPDTPRTWAAGVIPPADTKPGQAVDGVTLTLTKPAVVRGKVVDAAGKPVGGRTVYALPTDGREGVHFDPRATSAADGTFTLAHLRPTEQVVQLLQFRPPHAKPVAGNTKTLTLRPGETVEGVVLVVAGDENGTPILKFSNDR